MTADFFGEANPEPTPPPDKPEAKTYGDAVEKGDLFTKPDPDICKWIHDEFGEQDHKYQRLICEAEVNERRRGGEANLWVNKSLEQHRWQVYVAPGLHYANAFYQKADRLVRRVTSNIYADPAELEAIPTTGDDDDRDAAEVTERVLAWARSEAVLDDAEAQKAAFDIASNWGSGHIWYYTNPKGAGRQPIEVEVIPGEGGPAYQTFEENAAAMATYKGPLLDGWFVAQDGQLTQDQKQAALRWMPKVERQVCTPGNLRFWPATSDSIWDAEGCLYACYHEWGVLTNWYEELADVGEEERDKAITFRLDSCKHLLPKRFGRVHDPKPKPGHENNGLALLMIFYAKECGAYPEGAYFVTVGERLVPFKGPWILDGPKGREQRDLPFSQVIQWRGGRDYPQGKPLMAFLGALDELRGEMYGRYGEWLEKQLQQKWFYSPHSMVRPEQMDDPFGTLIPTMPGTEPKPMTVPEVPRSLPDMIERTTREMDDASSLQESGQGLQTPDVTSGRQALTIVSQVQAGLADVNQHVLRAQVRSGRIIVQEIRVGFTMPQKMRLLTPDGGYKVDRWEASTLGTTRDVQIRRGTGTMMNPMQKVTIAQEYAQVAGWDPLDVGEVVTSGVSQYTAKKDNVFTQRIRRQLHAWEEGPPPDWQPPVAPLDPLGQPQMQAGPPDPLTGLPGMPMPVPPPPDPLLLKMWEPSPADVAPFPARIRARELAIAMSKQKYQTFPPEWRVPLEMEYQRVTQALMPPPGAPPPAQESEPKAENQSPTPKLMGPEKAVLGEDTSHPSGATAPVM